MRSPSTVPEASATRNSQTSWPTRKWSPPGIKNRFRAILEASGPTWWTTELAAKDARLATEFVDARGTTRLWIGPVLRDLYQAAADAGFRDDDVALVSRMYR